MSEVEGRRPLVLLGDSHLARFHVGRMADMECALDGLVIVHNHAIGGASSADLVQRAPVEAAIRGALFVISVGTNDLAPWKQVPPAEFAANSAKLLQTLGGSRSVVVLPPPVDEVSQARSRGGQGRTNSLVVEYGGMLSEVAREAGGQVVDVGALLNGKEGVHEADGVHLSPDGYAVLLHAITTGVRPLLAG